MAHRFPDVYSDGEYDSNSTSNLCNSTVCTLWHMPHDELRDFLDSVAMMTGVKHPPLLYLSCICCMLLAREVIVYNCCLLFRV